MKKKVIIVGAGIAGLTATAYLCKAGFEPILLEQSSAPGGLVNSYESNGFHFDAGIRAFENAGILLPILQNLGLDIKFYANPITMQIGDQSFSMQGASSVESFENALRHLFPDNLDDISRIMKLIRRTMSYMDVLYAVDNPLFNENMTDLTYLRKEFLPWYLAYQKKMRKALKINSPIYEKLGKLTHNQALIDVIAQHFFSKTPAFFALSYFWLYQEYLYPKNGTSELIDQIFSYIKDHGGQIQYQQRVREIQHSKHLLFTDELAFSYDELIWAADGASFYQALNLSYLDGIRQQKKISQKQNLTLNAKGSDSVISLFLGVDLPNAYFSDKHQAHLFFTPSLEGISSITHDANSHWKNYFEEYLEKTTFEISIPALRNSTLAPDGKTGLIISTLGTYDTIKKIQDKGKYEQFKEFVSKQMISVLENTIYPGLSEHITYQFLSTPLTYQTMFLNQDGAINGWSFENENMPCIADVRKMTKTILTPMKNIYHIGQWTYSPAGLPTSILTGKLAADKIINKKK